MGPRDRASGTPYDDRTCRTEAASPAGGRRRLLTIVSATLLLLTLALVLLAAGPAEDAAADGRYAAPEGQTDDIVIYDRGLYFEVHVSLTGEATPFQIGQQYAQAMLQAEPWWMTYVYIYMTGAHFLIVDYDKMVARAAAIKQQLPPAVKGYIEGMASVVTKRSGGWVDENDCYLLNLYPDIARPTACSALGAWGRYTAGGRPILGRNLDWSTDPILPKLNAVTVYHNGSKSFCSLGYLGLWQVISGFNKSGLYGGILDAETGDPYPDPTNRRSYPMDLRTALETTTNITDAAKVLQGGKYCFNHQIVLADKTRVGILENDISSTGPWARKVRFDTTPLNTGITWDYKNAVCAVNSFVAKGNNSAKFGTPWNSERWKTYKAQLKMVENNVTVAKMKDMLAYGDPDSHTTPYNDQTVQMMVYQPVSRHLDIFMKPRSGGLPKNPVWNSIDIDFGRTMFGGRWVRTWQPAGWEVTDSRVAAAPGGDICAALQLSRDGGGDTAIGLVRYRPDGRRRWTRLIDPAGETRAELAGLAVASGTVVVGGTQSLAGEGGWLLARYNEKGKRAWVRIGSGPAGHIDRLGGLVCDAKGNVYAGGALSVADGAAATEDWCLRKLSPAGTQRWERVLASGTGLDERVTGVCRLGATTVVTGTWAADGSVGQLATARFSDSGARRWFTPWTHDEVTAPEPTGVCARRSGVAVSGRDASPFGGHGRVAFRLDPQSGAVEWSFADSPDRAGESSAFHDVAIDAEGRVTAGGLSQGIVAAGQLGLVSWFGEDGTETPALFGGDSGANSVTAVACADGGAEYGGSVTYAAGATTAAAGEPRLMSTTAWSAKPEQRWSITFGGSSASDAPCAGHDLTLRGAKLFVSGAQGSRFVLAKYDVTTAALEPPKPD